MKTTWQFTLILGALTLGAGGFALSTEAKTRHCTSEECACEQALQKNTVEALEAFLKKYPQSVDGGKTACAALGIPSGGEGNGDPAPGDANTPTQQEAAPQEG